MTRLHHNPRLCCLAISITLALLGGCAGTQIPADTLNTTRTAWLEAGYPDIGDCRIDVLYTDRKTVDEKCRPTVRCSASGCTISKWALFGPGRLLLVIDQDKPRTLYHELVHAFGICSGMGADPGHTGEQWGGYLKGIGGYSSGGTP